MERFGKNSVVLAREEMFARDQRCVSLRLRAEDDSADPTARTKETMVTSVCIVSSMSI